MKYTRSSDKHQYSLGVEKSFNNEFYLVSYVFYSLTPLDKILVGDIDKSEIGLNSGRFVNYIATDLPYHVQISAISSLRDNFDKFETFINFIDKNITGLWNLSVWVTSFNQDGRIIWDFTFENPNDALVFKLKFS